MGWTGEGAPLNGLLACGGVSRSTSLQFTGFWSHLCSPVPWRESGRGVRSPVGPWGPPLSRTAVGDLWEGTCAELVGSSCLPSSSVGQTWRGGGPLSWVHAWQRRGGCRAGARGPSEWGGGRARMVLCPTPRGSAPFGLCGPWASASVKWARVDEAGGALALCTGSRPARGCHCLSRLSRPRFAQL